MKIRVMTVKEQEEAFKRLMMSKSSNRISKAKEKSMKSQETAHFFKMLGKSFSLLAVIASLGLSVHYGPDGYKWAEKAYKEYQEQTAKEAKALAEARAIVNSPEIVLARERTRFRIMTDGKYFRVQLRWDGLFADSWDNIGGLYNSYEEADDYVNRVIKNWYPNIFWKKAKSPSEIFLEDYLKRLEK